MVVADTNVVIWMLGDRRELSSRAAEVLRLSAESGGIAIAYQSLWEVAMLYHRNKVALPIPLADYLSKIEQVFSVLPMNAAIAGRSVQFCMSYPRDPSDRIIGATALVHGLELVTNDDGIRESGEVPCIW